MKSNVRWRKAATGSKQPFGAPKAARARTEIYVAPLKVKQTPHREKIVVVDKDHTLANSMVNILQRHGYCALAAFSGEEGVHLARHFSPHCMLAEFFMPDTNGVELLVALEEAVPQCKFLFTSYHSRAAELVDRARQKGFSCEFLAKPLAEDALLHRVSALFEEEESAAQPLPRLAMFAKASAA
jgi:DNA-binding NtrC family response regulator